MRPCLLNKCNMIWTLCGRKGKHKLWFSGMPSAIGWWSFSGSFPWVYGRAITMCTKIRILMASQIYWVYDCLIRNKERKRLCWYRRQTTEWNTLGKNEPILHCVQLWPRTRTFCEVALWAGCGHSRTFQPGLPFMFLLSRPLLALFWSFLADQRSHRKH